MAEITHEGRSEAVTAAASALTSAHRSMRSAVVAGHFLAHDAVSAFCKPGEGAVRLRLGRVVVETSPG